MLEKKRQILKRILGSYQKVGDEYLFECPLCKEQKRKLSVNIRKDVFKCWLCGYRGFRIRRVVRKYGSSSELHAWDEICGNVDIADFEEQINQQLSQYSSNATPNIRIELPQEYKTLFVSTFSSREAMSYLTKERGLSKKDIIQWKMGYAKTGKYQGRIIVPSFDISGCCSYYVTRSYEEWRKPKYLNPSKPQNLVFNELMIDYDADVVVTEGVFDAIKADNAVPLLGSTIEKNSVLFQKLHKHDSSVYLALDSKEYKKTHSLMRLFLGFGIELFLVDVSGFKDVGEMTKEIFEKRKQGAQFVDENLFLEYKLRMV